jgi:hypothetical protein
MSRTTAKYIKASSPPSADRHGPSLCCQTAVISTSVHGWVPAQPLVLILLARHPQLHHVGDRRTAYRHRLRAGRSRSQLHCPPSTAPNGPDRLCPAGGRVSWTAGGSGGHCLLLHREFVHLPPYHHPGVDRQVLHPVRLGHRGRLGESDAIPPRFKANLGRFLLGG